ncbi:MAG: hypothetical protein ACLSH5_05895 [Christensenellales bacterium]
MTLTCSGRNRRAVRPHNGIFPGSAYALRFALDNPERVGKMMLIAPGGIPRDAAGHKLMDSSILGGVASMLYGMRTVERCFQCYFDPSQSEPRGSGRILNHIRP